MRTRRLGLLALAVSLTLGVAGLSAACGPKDGGVAETTVPAGPTLSYIDSTYGFSFDYPADWEVVTSEGDLTSGADPTKVVTVGDPNGAKAGDSGLDLLMIRVYQLSQVVDEASLSQFLPVLEGLVADIRTQDPSLKIVQPLTRTTVAGIPGYQVTSTFDWDADTPMKTTFYFLFAGDIEYQLLVQAAAKTWQADQEVFAMFLASFKPGAADN